MGPQFATGVIATDTLPAGIDNLVIAASQGSGCTNAAIFTCSLGTLNVGGSAFVTVTGRAIVTGSLPNTVTVSAAQVDINLANNIASATITVGMVNPGINVDQEAGTAAKGATYYLNTPGGSVTYAYTVTNSWHKCRSSTSRPASPMTSVRPVTYASGDTNSNNILETTETWRFNCTTNITDRHAPTPPRPSARPARLPATALPGIRRCQRHRSGHHGHLSPPASAW